MLSSCLGGAQAAWAQAAVAKADTTYYSAKGQPLPSRAGAARLVATQAAPIGGVVQRIYNRAGALLEQIPYADAQAQTRAGIAQSWLPTGELKGRRTYKAGQLEGQLLLYYPDGTLQRLEIYHQGKLKSRQCFSPTGQVDECPPEQLQLVGKTYADYQWPVWPGQRASE